MAGKPIIFCNSQLIPDRVFSHVYILIGFLLFSYLRTGISLAAASEDFRDRLILVKGDHYYPPWEFINQKGEPDGFNVELFKLLAKELNLDFQLKLEPWAQVREELETGRIDAITGMMHTAGRSENVLFGLPHSVMAHGIFVQKGSTIKSLEDLTGKSLVVQRGDVMHDYLIETGMSSYIILVDSQLEALELISLGMHDAALVGIYQGMYLARNHGLKNIIQRNLGLEPFKYSIAVSKGNDELLDLLNMGIYQLKVSGAYDDLFEEWFAIYEDNYFLRRHWMYIAGILTFFLILLFFVIFMRYRMKKATRNLAESEQRFRSIAENASDLIYRYEFWPTRGFSFVSPSSTTITGYTPEEHYTDPELGFRLIHPDDRFLLESLFENAGKSSAPVVLRWIKKNGSMVWIEQRNVPVFDKNHKLIALEGIARDITERKRMEDEIFQSEARLRALVDILQKKSLNTQELIDYSLGESLKLTKSRFGYIFLYDEDKEKFTVNTWSKDVLKECSLDDPKASYGLNEAGLWGEAVRQRQPILVNDYQAANSMKKGCPEGHITLSKFLTVPVFVGEKIVALVGVANKEKDYNEIDILQLTLLMDTVWKIIEQRNIEQEVARNERLLQKIFDVLPIGIWITDKEGKLLKGNPAGVRIWGGEPLVGPENYKIFKARKLPEGTEIEGEDWALLKTIKDGATILGELLEIDTFDGKKRIIQNSTAPILDDNGKIDGAIVVNNDITDIRKIQDEILKLSATTEQSPASVIITNTDGEIEYVNSKFIETSGYSKEELTGKKLRIFKPEHTSKDTFRELEQRLGSALEWSGEYLNRRKNRETYWEYVIISPLKNNDGKIINYIVISEDVSGRKRMESELIEAKEKAEESDRLKTAFLNNLSHEIRTPLNAIIGFTGFITEPDLTDEKKEQFSQIIKRSSNQLLSIITDIINISLLESGRARAYEIETDINQLLDNLYDHYSFEFSNKGVHFEIQNKLSNSDAKVLTDDTKLTQILTNLLDNALKFTDSGYVEAGCYMEHNKLHFYVKDTGIGIHPDFHEKIFKRFMQIDISDQRAHGGNGLGLAISKSYVELLNGKIWLESEPGRGSTFSFYLPYNPFGGTPPEASGHEEPESLKTKPIILVAEDDEINFLLTEEILIKNEMEVIHARNGEEALNLCKDHNFDLVLMDIKMPVMDGFTATKRIKELHPGLPVIALTAYALSGDYERALAEGCDDYISKPVTKSKLMDMVGKFLSNK